MAALSSWSRSPGCGSSLAGVSVMATTLLLGGLLAGGERSDEGFLRHFDPTDHLHALLALLLLLQQLALGGDVTAVALGEHVLADRPDVLASDDAGADRGLDGHLEVLPRDQPAQLR